jgi:hypothetical protein
MKQIAVTVSNINICGLLKLNLFGDYSGFKEIEAFKNISHGTETVFPLMRHAMDPLWKEVPWLLL